MLLSALKHHMKELNLEAVDISLVRKTPGLQGCVVREIQFLDSYVKLVWAQLSNTHLCFCKCGHTVLTVILIKNWCFNFSWAVTHVSDQYLNVYIQD